MKDWDALYEECIHCQKCGLAETRTNVVFGEGARDAEVRAPASRRTAPAGPLWAGRANCWTICWP